MVERRIKPYFEEQAEKEQRVAQTRVFRRNQVDWTGDGGCGILVLWLLRTNPKWIFPHRLVAPVSIACSGPYLTIAARCSRWPWCILGPTGSGKTALSLELAERFNGEIVSCDSVAVYRGMELGTAKPTLGERARVPHHLIDVTTPDVPFTAGEYSRQARAALKTLPGEASCRS